MMTLFGYAVGIAGILVFARYSSWPLAGGLFLVLWAHNILDRHGLS